MYKLVKDPTSGVVGIVQKQDGAMLYSIPFDPNNTDYQKFKIDVADGIPLEDPDGNVMTKKQINAFLETLP